jgi:hypothetical protein
LSVLTLRYETNLPLATERPLYTNQCNARYIGLCTVAMPQVAMSQIDSR